MIACSFNNNNIIISTFCALYMQGMNGLHVAAKYGQLECLQYLLENCSVDVNCGAVSTGSSALHYSTAHTNATKRLQCTKLLLKHGGNLKR